MKRSHIMVLAALVIGTAAAQETQSVKPQPRMRIDPATRSAVAEPKTSERGTTPDGAVAMSPFIVRSTRITANAREPDRLPSGPISMLSGGWIHRSDSGGIHTEVGMWPYQNILWKNDSFKSDKMHVGTEFVRISW